MPRPKEALIVTNIHREQPGTILNVLRQRGWKTTVVNLDQGDAFPSPKTYGALIVMGGPPSANDSREQTPWMPQEIARIQEALAERVPYLGVCLGMQTLVKAAGGNIIQSPRKEVGFRDSYGEPPGTFYSVQLTEEGRRDPLFTGLPDTLPVFHLHGESVELPQTMNPSATLIATGDVVPNQVVRIGSNAYGTQGHFELTPEMLEVWLREDPDLLNVGKRGIEQVRKDFEQLQAEYTKTATTMYNNFFQLAEQ